MRRMTDERSVPYVGELKTIEEAIAWLREAARVCEETAKNLRSPGDVGLAMNLRGRSSAFGLAARIVEDVIRRDEAA